MNSEDYRYVNPAAFDDVDHDYINRAAVDIGDQLKAKGFAHFVLEPDDGTRYELMIVTRVRSDQWDSPQFMFASSFGTAYPWNGNPTIHPDYAAEHYVANGNTWTAVVYSLLLNAVAEVLRESQEAGRA